MLTFSKPTSPTQIRSFTFGKRNILARFSIKKTDDLLNVYYYAFNTQQPYQIRIKMYNQNNYWYIVANPLKINAAITWFWSYLRWFIGFNLCNGGMQFAENVHGRIPIYQELFMKLVIRGRYARSLRNCDEAETIGVTQCVGVQLKVITL